MFTIGNYLSYRLESLGIKDYFAIPGDYNLVLLDEILKNKNLRMINCCNELNAGYAADGYARVNGISALFVTFSVGGLSALNAIAGAYAENLPVLVISGGPNTHSVRDAEILHHTLGNENHQFVADIFEKVTAKAVRIQKPENAPQLIDAAIATAIASKKPVYIEIACNIADSRCSKPTKRAFNATKISDSCALSAAVADAAEKLNHAVKPCLILGSKTRSCEALIAVEKLVSKAGYAMAVMPDAKGFISETHPNFIGIYWGQVSSPGCAEVVDSSDAYILIGPNENDYTTVGHMWGIQSGKSVSIGNGTVRVGGNVYTDIYMNDFLGALEKELKFNESSLKVYQRIAGSASDYLEPKNLQEPLNTRYLFGQIQQMLDNKKALLAETGDSWFNTMRLRLPQGCPFEIQMQYGSIGWSVGALLGMQAALHNQKRVIACIGDGSFQMSAQEVSTMIRYGFKPVIFLMNNAAYTIEVQIHDGVYNVINNWRYSELIHAFQGEQSNARAFMVRTKEELLSVLKEVEKTDALCFIEVILDKDDCNKHLLEWGSRVAAYNSRPPQD